MRIVDENSFGDWLTESLPDEYKQYVGNSNSYYDKYDDNMVEIEIKNCVFDGVKERFPGWISIGKIVDSEFHNMSTFDVSMNNLSNVVFKNTNIDDSSFRNDLHDVQFIDCIFKCEFENVNFKNVIFKNCILNDTYFSNCIFKNFQMLDSKSNDVQMADCKWNVVLDENDNEIINTIFTDCRFQAWYSNCGDDRVCRIESVIFKKCMFTNLICRGVSMSYPMQMMSCSLSDCDMKTTIGVKFTDDCNFEKCDLRHAIIFNTDYRNFDIENHGDYQEDENTIGINSNIPEEGSFIGFKLADFGRIVKLKITENAFRIGAGTDRRCKCSEAEILAIEDLDGNVLNENSVRSYTYGGFEYVVGTKVTMWDDDFGEDDARIEAMLNDKTVLEIMYDRFYNTNSGIYFFLTRKECKQYARNMNW